MNGIEKITQRIAQDADAEIEQRAAQARETADRILADCTAQADQERTEALEKGRRAAQDRREHLDNMAQMEVRKTLLAAKQIVIQEAFDLALERLCGLPEKKMVPLLAKLAATYAESGQEQIILNPAHRDRYGQAVADQANALLKKRGKLTLGEPSEQIRGGLILRKGPVDINCTFELLVRQQRSQLSDQTARVLFPEG